MREATSIAAATIAQLHLASVRMAYRGIVPDAVLDALTERDRRVYWDRVLARRNGETFGYVVEDEAGRLLGIAAGGVERSGDPRYGGELYVLHVYTAAQHQGIGRSLTRAVVARLAADGIETLLIWVARANTSARRFYAALGGEIVREQVRAFGAGTLPEVAIGWRDTAPLRRDNGPPTS